MIGIDPVLIKVTISAGCLKFSSGRVMIYYLKFMFWDLSLISVVNKTTFKI